MSGSVPPPTVPGRPGTSQPTSRQLLAALETMAGVGYCTLSFADGRVHASDGLHMIAGTASRVGTPMDLEFIEAHTHPEDRAGLVESFHLLMRDIMPGDGKLRLVRDDGTTRHLDMRFQRLVDEQRQPLGWMICAIDRTERESLRSTLDLTRNRLRAALHQVDADLTWFSSLDGRLVERVVQSLPSHAAEPLTTATQRWAGVIHPDDRILVTEAVAQAEPMTSLIRVALKPGHYAAMHTRTMPVTDESGETVELLGLSSVAAPSIGSDLEDALSPEDRLTGPLVRAARSLLGWTIPVLAEHSGVSASTIMRVEEAKVLVIDVARRRTAERLAEALTAGGVSFHRTGAGKLAISL